MESKNAAFQQLRAPCVDLSQAILTFRTHSSSSNTVTECLGRLLLVLQRVAEQHHSLGPKLADYAFFPLSQVLSASQKLPLQALELSLQCLVVLVDRGWREQISSSLSSQLLILLTFTADRSQKISVSSETTDDTQKAAFQCLSSLFVAMGLSAEARSSLVQTANVPSLGHAITTVLDSIADSKSHDVQIAAVEALEALTTCLTDREVVASFLPGIVSNLSKVLTPSTQSRRPWKVLSKSLKILKTAFGLTISDQATSDAGKTITKPASQRLDGAWLEATTGQLKLALANINKSRTHVRPEVRDALFSLNCMVISDCKSSLLNCRQMALETAIVLVESSENEGNKMRLDIMVRGDPSVADMLQTTVRDWTVSLSRIMQSNDDQAKERRLRQIFTAFRILTESGIDVRTPYRLLASALQASVAIILQPPLKTKKSIAPKVEPVMLRDLSLITTQGGSLSFTNPLSEYKSQKELLDLIRSQVQIMASSASMSGLGFDLVNALRQTEGDAQVATLWLLLTALDSPTNSDPLSEFLFLDDTTDKHSAALLEEAYSFALATLESDAENGSWRLKALSLELVALAARTHGSSFRVELIDVLYPVLSYLGSENAYLRNHAIVCLNIVASSCSYVDVKDLIVQNVDYLVNAIALKLNAFDVSPQGPQVLLMMVRLAGPSLLPYLEDTVESIFAALEDYHGYPALVELLFRVLGTMAEEGVKAPMLTIGASEQSGSRVKGAWEPTSIATLAQILIARRKKANDNEARDTEVKTHPQKPWKESKPPEPSTPTLDDLLQEKDEGEDPSTAEEITDEPAKSQPPAPKTYSLLLKITQLTQHYLSSSSPSLRTSLLSLIGTTIPALARHEDSYLSLVNTLWPELVSRLHDPEPHIIAGSLDIIAIMSEYAGVFMKSRIQSLWPEVKAIHSQLAKEMFGGQSKSRTTRGSSSLLLQTSSGEKEMMDSRPATATAVGYVDTSTRAVSQSLEKLLLAVVGSVGADADMFDDVLRMLRPLSKLSAGRLEILRAQNPDAVWLALFKEKPYPLQQPRQLEAVVGWSFVAVVAG